MSIARAWGCCALLLATLSGHAAQAQVPTQVPGQVPAPAAPPAGSEAEAALGRAQLYGNSESYRRLVTQAVARVPASVAPRCPRFGTSKGSFDIAQPLQLGAGGGLTAGAWHQAVLAQGCGAEVQLNFFFFANLDGRVLTVVGVPGNSRADLAQQRDARTYVLVALQPFAPSCGQFETMGTRFEGFGSKAPAVPDPGAGAQFRPWWESWIMLGCGKRYEVPLNFTPNRLGTQIVQPGGIVAAR